jgi:hypothetical protein
MPTGFALDARGRPRYPGGPRTYPRKLRFRPVNRGNVLGVLSDPTLVGRGAVPFAPEALSGRLRDVSVVYLLLTQVDLPPHFYLRNGVRMFLPTMVQAVARVLRDRFGP